MPIERGSQLKDRSQRKLHPRSLEWALLSGGPSAFARAPASSSREASINVDDDDVVVIPVPTPMCRLHLGATNNSSNSSTSTGSIISDSITATKYFGLSRGRSEREGSNDFLKV